MTLTLTDWINSILYVFQLVRTKQSLISWSWLDRQFFNPHLCQKTWYLSLLIKMWRVPSTYLREEVPTLSWHRHLANPCMKWLNVSFFINSIWVKSTLFVVVLYIKEHSTDLEFFDNNKSRTRDDVFFYTTFFFLQVTWRIHNPQCNSNLNVASSSRQRKEWSNTSLHISRSFFFFFKYSLHLYRRSLMWHHFRQVLCTSL